MAIEPTSPAPDAPEDTLIQGHNYDGIEEYDNPMPGWWLWIFWITVIFAPIYFVGVHQAGFINTYTDDLAADQAEMQAVRDAYEATNPSFQVDDATLATFVADPAAVEAGATIFAANCLPCHGPQGGGLIGPNLTDDYWIHGANHTDLFNVITNGVVEKGMTPWGNILTPEQRAQVIAFVRSLHGTNPAGAKEPQGTLVTGA
jgi:cytochrome c oxidase cbb3-type subunit III